MDYYHNFTRFITFLVILGLATSCSNQLPESIQAELKNVPQEIDYNFHVKPILSDRCFACHGPDKQKQQADLRLDTEESAFAALTSGAGYAIVPGKSHQSELTDRILTEDPELAMPPAESNLELTDQEKAILIKWIDQGAKYEPHWAFIKPDEPIVPNSGEDWALNEIDNFIAAKLATQNIEPSEEAKREQLIRRAYFDITGLPPTIVDLDKWMDKSEESYYEEMVDNLLSSSAYGERMAAHWMDVARFADSEGYLDDFHHTFWPYRDWVIKAFNSNLPYDDFIVWQIGGDQLPNATTEQKLATAFNRNHKQNSEGGIIPEEFRVEYVADRTNTVGSAFMALTLGCARCHDHKYDPLSQEDYFQLFGFFNSTIERGDGIFSLNAIENGQMVSNKYSMNAGPVLPLLEEDAEEQRKFLFEKIEEQQQKIEQKERSKTEAFETWLKKGSRANTLSEEIEKSTVTHLTFDDMTDGKTTDLAKGASGANYNGNIQPGDGKIGKAVVSDAYGQLVADGSRAQFEHTEPFTVSFWIKIPKDFEEEAHVMYNGNNRIQGYRGWDITVENNKVHFRLSHAHPYQSLDIQATEPLPLNEWVHYVWTYDGSSKAEGMRIYQNGQASQAKIVRNFIYRSAKPYLKGEATIYMPYKGIIIGNRHYDQDFTGGMVDEVRILNKEADDMVALYLFDSEKGAMAFKEALNEKKDRLAQFYNLFLDKELEENRKALQAIRKKEIELIDTAQEIMVMGDFENERPTYILNRGVYDALGKQVNPDVPESIFKMPEDLPKNRLGLGKWLVHEDNPLTARVTINQMWYLMFGRGIVETVEDFGNQGALPTHPELLNWLSVDFQKNGWNLKRLIKQIVMSATYRQSSVVRAELAEIDPDNKLLARGPRYRRSAEMIRDNILASSGLLAKKVGGNSAFPYQPDGLWKEVMTHPFFPEYSIDYEDGLYRRSVYTFWKRNMPPPSMLIFDAASRAECQVRRQRSNTPLQALVLLNDPQSIEGCRVLAERVYTAAQGDTKEALYTAFRILTSRFPTDQEKQIIAQQYEEEYNYFSDNKSSIQKYLDVGYTKPSRSIPHTKLAATTRVINTIMNTTEAYYKN
ncbi:MAG: DUF1553 domain-containing protein [Cyclobacteriaceae bacterium]